MIVMVKLYPASSILKLSELPSPLSLIVIVFVKLSEKVPASATAFESTNITQEFAGIFVIELV